jgi:hypothetical protein
MAINQESETAATRAHGDFFVIVFVIRDSPRTQRYLSLLLEEWEAVNFGETPFVHSLHDRQDTTNDPKWDVASYCNYTKSFLVRALGQNEN